LGPRSRSGGHGVPKGPLLVTALSDSRTPVRAMAADALGRIPDAGGAAAEALLSRLRQEPVPAARARICERNRTPKAAEA